MMRCSIATLRFAVDQVYSAMSVPETIPSDRMKETHLWQELSCCILSSQVNYNLALSAARTINQAGTLSRARPALAGGFGGFIFDFEWHFLP